MIYSGPLLSAEYGACLHASHRTVRQRYGTWSVGRTETGPDRTADRTGRDGAVKLPRPSVCQLYNRTERGGRRPTRYRLPVSLLISPAVMYDFLLGPCHPTGHRRRPPSRRYPAILSIFGSGSGKAVIACRYGAGIFFFPARWQHTSNFPPEILSQVLKKYS